MHHYVDDINRKIPIQEAKHHQIILIKKRFDKSFYLNLNDVIYYFSERKIFNYSISKKKLQWLKNVFLTEHIGNLSDLLLIKKRTNLQLFLWFNSFSTVLIQSLTFGFSLESN